MRNFTNTIIILEKCQGKVYVTLAIRTVKPNLMKKEFMYFSVNDTNRETN